MEPTKHNPWELLNRRAKAEAIANMLAAHGISSWFAAMVSIKDRKMVAKQAGQTDPSVETWAQVVEMLKAREEKLEGVHA